MTYNVLLRGEDGALFHRECDASSPSQVLEFAEEMYPEATVLDIYDPEQRRQDALDRAQAMYDDPDLDDYDY